MQLKERLINEINTLPPEAVIDVYEMVLDLKNYKYSSNKPSSGRGKIPAYLRAQEILKKCTGSLSGDIISAREDRI